MTHPSSFRTAFVHGRRSSSAARTRLRGGKRRTLVDFGQPLEPLLSFVCPGRMTIPQGTQFGPYKIVEQIGSGGMGDVYRAVDTRLGREVAIKLVSDRYLAEAFGSGSPTPGSGTPATPGTLSHRRFLREAQIGQRAEPAHICTIHDIGEQDGRPYLVMELLRGETLKEALAAGGRLICIAKWLRSRGRRQRAGGGTCQGHYSPRHQAGKYLCAGAGSGRAADQDPGFRPGQAAGRRAICRTRGRGDGDVWRAGDLTAEPACRERRNHGADRPGSTLGTVAYMSPEQARGVAAGRADGSLQPGHGDVRDGDGDDAVPRRLDGGSLCRAADKEILRR